MIRGKSEITYNRGKSEIASMEDIRKSVDNGKHQRKLWEDENSE